MINATEDYTLWKQKGGNWTMYSRDIHWPTISGYDLLWYVIEYTFMKNAELYIEEYAIIFKNVHKYIVLLSDFYSILQ